MKGARDVKKNARHKQIEDMLQNYRQTERLAEGDIKLGDICTN